MKKTIVALAALSLLGLAIQTPATAVADPMSVHIFESVNSSFVPTESGFSNGTFWGLNSTYGIYEQDALNVTQGSRDVVVGVIDTGITSHSDLSANVIAGYDFITGRVYNSNGTLRTTDLTLTGDGDGRDSNPSDPGDFDSVNCVAPNFPAASCSSWHGTHVSGIIGATANGAGALGVSPTVSIMPLRALGPAGGIIPDIIDAITWGSGGSVSGITARPTKRADVINLSLGGTGSTCPTTLQTAIDSAVSRGTSIVVAAGNDGVDLVNTFPANCKNVVVVMATDNSGAKAYFSNYVSSFNASGSIYVSAPGQSIYSTSNTGPRQPVAETYVYMSGTSMAAPFVSGMVAMIYATKPTATVAEVRSVLNDAANTTAGINGVKILNVGKIIQAITGIPAPPVEPVAVPAPAPEIVNTPAPVVETAPVIAPAPLAFAPKKSFSAKSVATKSGIVIPKKSTVSLKVVGSKAACKIRSGKLATLKAGSCTVAVKVKTKIKVGKKYKTQTSTTTVAMVVQ